MTAATLPSKRTASLRMTPGRRVLLAIGVPVILAVILWDGFSLIASFGTATFAVSGTVPVVNGQVTAFYGGANATVNEGAAGGSTAQLTGRVQYSLIKPRFSQESATGGTRLHLACAIPFGTCQLTSDLAVPAGTAVNLSSQGGDMQVSGVTAEATLNSAGGNVTMSGGGSKTTVSTGGGDLTASSLGGTLNFTSSGGDVTGNGLTAPATTISSGGGDVTVVYTKVPDHLAIVSSGGDVTVLLPPGSTRYAVSETASGGDSAVSVPAGGSSHIISVNSGGGDITIAQSS
jgi:Putative adhesin